METLPQEVQKAIANCCELYNDNHCIEIASGKLKPATESDFAIFIRATGYAVIRKESYAKLGVKKKNLLSKGCTFIRL